MLFPVPLRAVSRSTSWSRSTISALSMITRAERRGVAAASPSIRDGPGYARKNYIVLSQINPDDTTGLHYFLCHELAHYWTPSPGPFSPDHWMSEAFAEYVAVRYLREHFGEEPFNDSVDRWEEMGRAHGPVWTPEVGGGSRKYVLVRGRLGVLERPRPAGPVTGAEAGIPDSSRMPDVNPNFCPSSLFGEEELELVCLQQRPTAQHRPCNPRGRSASHI